MKIEEKAKIRRRTNPEEANIRKRQKYGGVKNQEEAIGKSGGGKKWKNSKFQPLWARKASIEGGFIVSFAHQANHSFSGICAMLIEYCKYVQLRLDTDCNIFNRGNRFNHHGIMMQRIMLNLNSKTCLKTFMSWEDMFNSLLPHLLQTLLWKFYSCDPEI